MHSRHSRHSRPTATRLTLSAGAAMPHLPVVGEIMVGSTNRGWARDPPPPRTPSFPGPVAPHELLPRQPGHALPVHGGYTGGRRSGDRGRALLGSVRRMTTSTCSRRSTAATRRPSQRRRCAWSTRTALGCGGGWPACRSWLMDDTVPSSLVSECTGTAGGLVIHQRMQIVVGSADMEQPGTVVASGQGGARTGKLEECVEANQDCVRFLVPARNSRERGRRSGRRVCAASLLSEKELFAHKGLSRAPCGAFSWWPRGMGFPPLVRHGWRVDSP